MESHAPLPYSLGRLEASALGGEYDKQVGGWRQEFVNYRLHIDPANHNLGPNFMLGSSDSPHNHFLKAQNARSEMVKTRLSIG